MNISEETCSLVIYKYFCHTQTLLIPRTDLVETGNIYEKAM